MACNGNLELVYVESSNPSTISGNVITWANDAITCSTAGGKPTITVKERNPFNCTLVFKISSEIGDELFTIASCCDNKHVHCEYNVKSNDFSSGVKVINNYDYTIDDVNSRYGVSSKEFDHGRVKVNVRYSHTYEGNKVNHTLFDFMAINNLNKGENMDYHCAKFTLTSASTQTLFEMFDGCNELRYVNFPCGTSTINSGTCQDCTSLVDFEPKKTITSIRNYAFSGCSSLSGAPFTTTINGTSDTFELEWGLCLPNIGSFFPDSLKGCEILKGVLYKNTDTLASRTNFNTSLTDYVYDYQNQNENFYYLITDKRQNTSTQNDNDKYNFRQTGYGETGYEPVVNMTNLRWVNPKVFFNCVGIRYVVFDTSLFWAEPSSHNGSHTGEYCFGLSDADGYEHQIDVLILDSENDLRNSSYSASTYKKIADMFKCGDPSDSNNTIDYNRLSVNFYYGGDTSAFTQNLCNYWVKNNPIDRRNYDDDGYHAYIYLSSSESEPYDTFSRIDYDYNNNIYVIGGDASGPEIDSEKIYFSVYPSSMWELL